MESSAVVAALGYLYRKFVYKELKWDSVVG